MAAILRQAMARRVSGSLRRASPVLGAARFKASVAVELPQGDDSIFHGTYSTAYCSTPEFKTDVGEFKVLRQLNSDGSLVEGVKLPFSLEEAKTMYSTMVRSQAYDDVLNMMQRQGRISFYCTNYGEEATSVGSAAALAPQDMVWPQYRELGMFLWRGLTAQDMVDQCMANEGGLAHGRNLPVHYCLPDANVQTVHAVLGTHIPQAPGAGYAYRLEKSDKVSVAYFGDGAASEGDALTALNFAAVYGSQTLFICRNNGYSISTPVTDQYAGDGIAARGPAFGVATMRVDGNDLAAVYAATQAAREYIVREGKPALLELMTYRVGHHTTSDDSSLYRPEGEMERLATPEVSPLRRVRLLLEQHGLWDDAAEKAARDTGRSEVLAALAEGEKKMKPELRHLFTDTFATPQRDGAQLPWHLQEQHAFIEAHARANPGEYPTRPPAARGGYFFVVVQRLDPDATRHHYRRVPARPVPRPRRARARRARLAVDAGERGERGGGGGGDALRADEHVHGAQLGDGDRARDEPEDGALRRGRWLRRRLPLLGGAARPLRRGPRRERAGGRAGDRGVRDRALAGGLGRHRRDAGGSCAVFPAPAQSVIP